MPPVMPPARAILALVAAAAVLGTSHGATVPSDARAPRAPRAMSRAVNDSVAARARIVYTSTEPSQAGRTRRGTRLRDRPGKDVEPGGFTIYDSVAELPSYDVRAVDAKHERCYVRTVPACVKGSFCGYACEQVSVCGLAASFFFGVFGGKLTDTFFAFRFCSPYRVFAQRSLRWRVTTARRD